MLINKIKSNRKWKNQFLLVEGNKNNFVSWFGVPILLNKKYKRIKKKFLTYLDKNGIENRPIVSGNFLKQPSVKLYNLNSKGSFLNAQAIQDRGFFIGLHTQKLSDRHAEYLATKMLDIDLLK